MFVFGLMVSLIWTAMEVHADRYFHTALSTIQFASGVQLFNVTGIKWCNIQVVNAVTSQNSWQTHSLYTWIKCKSNMCYKFESLTKDKITKSCLLKTQTVCLLLKLFVLIHTCSYTHNFMTNVKNTCPPTILHMPLSKPCVFTYSPWDTMQPTGVCYAACGHTCKLFIYYKNYTIM
jgi:hypothetical protein